MVKEILSKRVTMFELFYDLVFVYMLSQTTEIIRNLHHGIVTPMSFLIFVIVMVVFLNSWMIQTVYTNRYGSSSTSNVIFSFINMMFVLYLSNCFRNLKNYRIFFVVAGLLSLTLFLQYLITYFQATSRADHKISEAFSIILGCRSLFLLVGGIISGSLGIVIALIGVVASWLAPGIFTGRYTKHHPIIFSHLLERLTLLTIITFGETIVEIADYFTKENFTGWSILIFAIVAGMFYIYVIEFDHFIEDHRRGETGNRLIYLHYPLIFGIIMVTVALNFINEVNANPYFAVGCLYTGILLFVFGMLEAEAYKKPAFKLNQRQIIMKFVGWVLGLGICLSRPQFAVIVVVTVILLGLYVTSTARQLINHRNSHSNNN